MASGLPAKDISKARSCIISGKYIICGLHLSRAKPAFTFMKYLSFLVLLLTIQLTALLPVKAQAKADEKTVTISSKTAGMKKMPGFFNLFWDEKAGKLY